MTAVPSSSVPTAPGAASGRSGLYTHHGRSLAIDMLRGIAILLVLGRHYVVAPENVGVVQPFAAAWTTIGWAGVDLFFVLSGFLVSGLLFAEYRQRGYLDLRRFVIRRGFKIWPPYLVYIAVLGGWLAWQQHAEEGGGVWAQLWPNVFHVQNYFHTPRVHTWSLAVEEHFYLAVALAFYVLLGRIRRAENVPHAVGSAPIPRRPGPVLQHLPTFIVACVAGLAALRHAGFVRVGPENLNLYATHLRFDGLLIGTLLAYWTHFEPAKLARLQSRPLTLMSIGVVLAAPTLVLSPEWSPWMAGIGLSGMYVGFALLMLGWLNVATVHAGWRRLFSRWPAALLAQVGFYSYSIYLWHIDLARAPIRKLLENVDTTALSPPLVWTLATALYVVVSVVAGAALARVLEIPSLALRDRLFPSAVKPLRGAPAATSTNETPVADPRVEPAPESTVPAR